MARKTLEVIPLAMHFKLSLTNAFPCQGQEDTCSLDLLETVRVNDTGTYKGTCFNSMTNS